MADADVACKLVQIIGAKNSREAFDLRDYLTRSVVDYEWIPVDSDDEARRLAGGSLVVADLPLVILPDGRRLVSPTVSEVARQLGWVTRPKLAEYDLSIYGAGPAGLSAAVYAASEGLKVAVIERAAVGGQAGFSSLIENYLGFPGGIAGNDLAERARQQAVSFGAELILLRGGMRGEFRDGKMHSYLSDGTVMSARSNICATGVNWRRLGIDREEQFLGLGLFYGAGASEAADCVGEDVYVVGGGNSAGQAALNLSRFSRSVTMLVRGNDLSQTLSSYLATRVRDHRNISVSWNSRVSGLMGASNLEGIKVSDTVSGEVTEHPTQRLFICIGGKPDTSWADGLPIARDTAGYLVTGPDLDAAHLESGWTIARQPFFLETSVPGSFAAGDVRHNSVKRVASAVGEGAMAVTFAHRFLEETV